MNQLEITFGGPLRVVVEQSQPPPDIKARIKVSFTSFQITGENLMYTLSADHTVVMEVTYVDANNNPATVDGEVTWQTSDPSIATLDVDQSDSSIVKVLPAGKVGQVQIIATADADLGQGIRNLVTPCDIEVVAGEAVAGVIQPLGEAQPRK